MQNEYTAIVLPPYEELIEAYLETHMTFPVVVNDPTEDNINPDQGGRG